MQQSRQTAQPSDRVHKPSAHLSFSFTTNPSGIYLYTRNFKTSGAVKSNCPDMYTSGSSLSTTPQEAEDRHTSSYSVFSCSVDSI